MKKAILFTAALAFNFILICCHPDDKNNEKTNQNVNAAPVKHKLPADSVRSSVEDPTKTSMN
jgi:hypothetical protein